MITITRERFEEFRKTITFCDEYDGMPDVSGVYDKDKVFAFIETIEKEAEDRMKEKCLECIPGNQTQEDHVVDFNSGWNEACETVRECISLL